MFALTLKHSRSNIPHTYIPMSTCTLHWSVTPSPRHPPPLSRRYTQVHADTHTPHTPHTRTPGLSSLKLERRPLLSAFHEEMRSLMVLKNWPLNHHFLIVHLLRSLPARTEGGFWGGGGHHRHVHGQDPAGMVECGVLVASRETPSDLLLPCRLNPPPAAA